MSCTQDCNQGRQCTCLITSHGFRQVDTESTPIDSVYDWLFVIAWMVAISFFVFALAMLGIVLPYFFT